MFQIGEFIVYGTSGVCQVIAIDYPNIQLSGSEKKQYYKLAPVFSSEVIYTPVDTSVTMRQVVSREEARRLIEQIAIGQLPAEGNGGQFEAYEALLKSHSCSDLIQLLKQIHYHNPDYLQSGKKLSATNQKYLKRAEELLYNELSIALGHTKEMTKDIINQSISEWLEKAE